MTTQTSELICRYISCCYPDDLQDHHNRDNELLLVACPDDSWDWVATELFENYCSSDRLIEINGEVVRDNEVKLAIDLMAESLYRYQINPKYDTDYDSPMIYAYLSW